jgi:hypothetical protein
MSDATLHHIIRWNVDKATCRLYRSPVYHPSRRDHAVVVTTV